MPVKRLTTNRKTAAQSAVRESTAASSETCCASASQAAARVPKVFPYACPSSGTTIAQTGRSPIAISRGAITATGTPKPVTP